MKGFPNHPVKIHRLLASRLSYCSFFLLNRFRVTRHVHRAGSVIAKSKSIVCQQLRLSRFHKLLSKRFECAITSCMLFTLLGGVGQLAPQINRTMPSASSSTELSPSDPEPMLQCALCDALIPLSDLTFSYLTCHETRSPANCTAVLLSDVLAPRHSAHCKGRTGREQLTVDDAHISVAERAQLSISIESFSGVFLFMDLS